MALDLDPPRTLPSLAALRTNRHRRADWYRAARYLEQEQMNTRPRAPRAKLLSSSARCATRCSMSTNLAVQSYELAIQATTTARSALPLVEEYARTERWPGA